MIGQATLRDVPALVRLENQLFTSDCISPRQFRYLISKARSTVVTIERGGIIQAYMILLHRRNSRRLRLYSIAVAASARKLGLARQLLRHAEAVAGDSGCTALHLEVREDNADAHRLYQAAGFHCQGRRPGYYEDGCAALLYSKEMS